MPQFPLFYFYFSEVPQLPLSLGQRRHLKGESLQSKSIDKKRYKVMTSLFFVVNLRDGGP